MWMELSESQQMVRDSAHDWLQANYGQAASDREGAASSAWSAFAEMGWLGLPFDERYGGSGLGIGEAGALSDAFGGHRVTEPYAFGLLAVGRVLASMGSDAQQQRWVPGLIEGSLRLAFAHRELHDLSPWGARRTKALRDSNGWYLSGTKIGVETTGRTDLWLVSAVVDSEAPAAVFCLPAGSEGLRVDSYTTLDGGQACDLVLDKVHVAQDYVLRSESEGGHALDEAIAHGVLALCWQAVGAIDGLVQATADYTLQRKQFGKRLAEFQVVQHRLAEMKVLAIEARACCEMSGMRLERGDGAASEIAQLATSKLGRAADYVAKQAVQLHGAMGVCEELPVAATFRWLQGFQLRTGVGGDAVSRAGASLLDSGRYQSSAAIGAFA